MMNNMWAAAPKPYNLQKRKQRLISTSQYCKFGNFRVTFISRIFYFPIISETLNSRSSTRAFYKAYSNFLLARTLFSRGNEFANISEN